MAGKEKKPREYRGVQDEIREQHMKAKDMSPKEKLQYFWDYYKVHTFVVIFAVIMAVTFIHDVATSKDHIFSGIMLNSYQLSAAALENAFAEYADLDLENYDCFIDTSSTLSFTASSQYDMATIQKIVAMIQTGDLDAVVYDSAVFNNYSGEEMFAGLDTVFTEDELKKYQDCLYYVDYAEIRRENEADVSEDFISSEDWNERYSEENVLKETEKHRHPEAMEEPVPVGVFLDDSPFVLKTGAYPQSGSVVFGIISTSNRIDTGKKFLEFLWDEAIDFTQMTGSGF